MNNRIRGKYNNQYSRSIVVDFSSLESPNKLNCEIWKRLRRNILDIKIEFDSDQKTFPNI